MTDNLCRTYYINNKGIRVSFVELCDWGVEIKERMTMIPTVKIAHLTHAGHRIVSDGRCSDCSEKVPNIVVETAIKIFMSEKPSVYGGMHDIRMIGMKKLAEDWNLVPKKKVLFHICAPNHPGGFFYGRGIPVNDLATYPSPNCCKTCGVEIPKGVLMALLLLKN